MKYQNIQCNTSRRVLYMFEGATLHFGNYVTTLTLMAPLCSSQRNGTLKFILLNNLYFSKYISHISS
jgi:hypothetical protein